MMLLVMMVFMLMLVVDDDSLVGIFLGDVGVGGVGYGFECDVEVFL